MRFERRSVITLLICFSSLAFSHTPKTITTIIPTAEQNMRVYLQRYPLTAKERQALADRVRTQSAATSFNSMSIEATTQLGMNHVPVLNQGGYGSCVTFANIAAIDALLAPEDYISLWCHLTLGQYLEEHSKNYQSGWDGSFGEIVLNQIYYYGAIRQSEERMIRCGNVDSYGAAGATRAKMSLADFNQHSESLSNISWFPVLNYMEGFYFKAKKMTDILNQVKATLYAGDRMTLGFLIDEHEIFIGAIGKHHTKNDTWVMTPEIEKNLLDGNVNAGHEVIITGFDDEAVVYDSHGVGHQGVLTLRNSWGEQAGDHGDYYMTYDYFLLMAVEVQRIFKLE